MDIFKVVEGIGDFIKNAYSLIENMFKFAGRLVSLIPSPFNIILGTFLGILMIIIVYKVVH